MTARFQQTGLMSVANRVIRVATSRGRGVAVSGSSTSLAAAPFTFAVGSGQRELRLDLFRGLALWLIYIDHVSPDILTWGTIRNYQFSDAAEIFIFISGFTAALVYGRAMFESGMLIGTARVLRRVWQIYTVHLLLFLVLIGEIAYVTAVSEKSFYIHEMEVAEFFNEPGQVMIQALLLRFRPLNMDVLPLYIVLMASLPLVLMLARSQRDLPLILSVALYILRSGSTCICRPIRTVSGRSIRLRGSFFSFSAPGARWAAGRGYRPLSARPRHSGWPSSISVRPSSSL